MKAKNRRLVFLLVSLLVLGGGVGLIISALGENIEFFYSPSDLYQKSHPFHEPIRIGGLVETGSLRQERDGAVRFAVTDGKQRIEVQYRGLLPDLFREGQGVVARGKLVSPGRFAANQILAKHDENYMPPEITDALKRASQSPHPEEAKR